MSAEVYFYVDVPSVEVVRSHPLLLFSFFLGGVDNLRVHVWEAGVVGDACLAIQTHLQVVRVGRVNWTDMFNEDEMSAPELRAL